MSDNTPVKSHLSNKLCKTCKILNTNCPSMFCQCINVSKTLGFWRIGCSVQLDRHYDLCFGWRYVVIINRQWYCKTKNVRNAKKYCVVVHITEVELISIFPEAPQNQLNHMQINFTSVTIWWCSLKRSPIFSEMFKP